VNGFRTTIAGNDSTFRIFMVTSTGNLRLQGLTLTGGNTGAPGGGIFNLEGTLTLNRCVVTGNASAGGMMSAGGGIASGPLTLKLSLVTGNSAAEGGGIFASS